MTQERVFELITEAESGNVESMKKVASIFMQVAEQEQVAGRIEQSLFALELFTKWSKKLKELGEW